MDALSFYLSLKASVHLLWGTSRCRVKIHRILLALLGLLFAIVPIAIDDVSSEDPLPFSSGAVGTTALL